MLSCFCFSFGPKKSLVSWLGQRALWTGVKHGSSCGAIVASTPKVWPKVLKSTGFSNKRNPKRSQKKLLSSWLHYSIIVGLRLSWLSNPPVIIIIDDRILIKGNYHSDYMISDDHIPQIPLDHHDSIFKLPCGGKESPKGIQKIVATQVSPQSEMVSMSDVGAWHFNHYRQGSRFHVAMIVMIQLQSWRTVATGCFFTPLRYLAPANCTYATSAKSANSQINGWSVDDQSMISWWLERNCWVIWGCNGRNRRRALGQFGSRSSGRQLWNTTVSCHKKSALILKNALLIQTNKFFRMLLWAPT